MSPEQLRGEIPDARGDQFSFCAALYEGLYRRRPFAGGTLTELTALVRRGTLEPPPADAAVPSSIWRVLERGLQIDERDRFASMDELLEALDAARKPTGARPRTGPLRAGIGAVGVLGALGAVWFGLTRPDPPEEASALQPLAALADPTMASPSGESAAAPELPGPEVSVSPEKPAAQRFDLGSATEEIAEVAGEEVAPARRRRKRSTPRVERMRPPSPLTRADMLAKLRKRAAACEGNVGHRVQFQVLTTGGTAAVRVVPKNPCIHAAVRSATFPAGQRVDALSFDVAATRSDRQPEDPPGSE